MKDFLEAIGSVLDIYPATDYKAVAANAVKVKEAKLHGTDAERIAGDWKCVGDYLRAGMEEQDRRLSNNSR